MSLKTWKAEFYPVPAGTTTNVEACKHSLRKWRGALPENLERHGVQYKDGRIIGSVFEFDGISCALCLSNSTCGECPVVRCGELKCGVRGSSYDVSMDDPSPMIATLEKALAWAKEQEAAQ